MYELLTNLLTIFYSLGKHGKKACRYNYPRKLVQKDTGPTQIEEFVYARKSDNSQHEKSDKELTVVNEITLPNTNIRAPIQPRAFFDSWGDCEQPTPPADSRILLYEITRKLLVSHNSTNAFPDAIPRVLCTASKSTEPKCFSEYINENVVEHSPMLSAAIPGNSAIYMLGAEEQAQAAAMYIVDYMVKDANSLQATLSAGMMALDLSKKYKSIAEDAGEVERTGKYFIQKFISQYSNTAEVSTTQAAAIVLQLPSSFSSIGFQYLFVKDMLAYVKDIIENRTGQSNQDDFYGREFNDSDAMWSQEDEDNFEALSSQYEQAPCKLDDNVKLRPRGLSTLESFVFQDNYENSGEHTLSTDASSKQIMDARICRERDEHVVGGVGSDDSDDNDDESIDDSIQLMTVFDESSVQQQPVHHTTNVDYSQKKK